MSTFEFKDAVTSWRFETKAWSQSLGLDVKVYELRTEHIIGESVCGRSLTTNLRFVPT
jgi:hypothetical protein